MNLKINEGISSDQIQDLIKFSNSDSLISTTTRDNIRFKNLDAFKKWQLKKRKIYVLCDSENNLQGIIWFGIEKLPKNFKTTSSFDHSKYGITFAIRIYEKARGKGFAQMFIKEAFEMYKKTEEYKNDEAKGIWLITNSDNTPAIKAYKNFGFKNIPEIIENGKLLMVFDK